MIKKVLFIACTILLIVASTGEAGAQRFNYVRKKAQPNFFIPQKDLAEYKPEKVGIPQYRRGQSTTKHLSSDDNYEEMLAAKQRRFQIAQEKWNTAKNNVPTNTNNESQASKEQNNDDEEDTENTSNTQKTDPPSDYKTKYQEYLKDLDEIARSGSLSDNPDLIKDLSAMSSEERIEVDKKFNFGRDMELQSEIEAILK